MQRTHKNYGTFPTTVQINKKGYMRIENTAILGIGKKSNERSEKTAILGISKKSNEKIEKTAILGISKKSNEKIEKSATMGISKKSNEKIEKIATMGIEKKSNERVEKAAIRKKEPEISKQEVRKTEAKNGSRYLEAPQLINRGNSLCAETQEVLSAIKKAMTNYSDIVDMYSLKMFDTTNRLYQLAADLREAKLETCTLGQEIAKEIDSQSLHYIDENEFDDYMNDELLSDEFKQYLQKVKHDKEYSDDEYYSTSSTDTMFSC